MQLAVDLDGFLEKGSAFPFVFGDIVSLAVALG
jgi:hypothetical protein